MSTMENEPDRDRPYLSVLDGVTFQPIFIMGDHRSGTTVLYEILGATGCFNIVSAYHIIKRHEILYNYVNNTVEDAKAQLLALFHRKGLRDRGIDQVQAGPDTPEEYGFALRPAGYRPQLKPGNLASFVELCKKIQLTSDPTRPILLKNPWDVLNFVYVKTAFPDSRFVFIHRNPIHTINSQLKATRALLGARNEYVAMIVPWYRQLLRQPIRLQMAKLLFSPYLGLGVRIVTRHVARVTDYFLQHVSTLPQSDYICVRYEDLCGEPKVTVKRILDWLGLEEKASVEYESLVNVRQGALLSEVERSQASIFRRMRPYFESFGYESLPRQVVANDQRKDHC